MAMLLAAAPAQGAQQTSQLGGRQAAQPASQPVSRAIIRYDSIHHPVRARGGMVVSQRVAASQVGADILARGGNAVDAAVATGFALAVNLPRAGNLGGSGFMLVYLRERDEVVALDFRSTAPSSYDPANYLGEDGKRDRARMTHGPMAMGVPGTVAGLHEAWRRHGSLPWEQLLQPALEMAREGIPVTADMAYALGQAQGVLENYAGSRTAYLRPDGNPYQAGETIRQPGLAWSIEQIARDGPDAFYKGAIAERIDRHMRQVGGALTRDDLAAYRVRERRPVEVAYRGHRVVTMAPSSAGGLTLAQMLKALGHFPMAEMPQGGADSLHVLAEVMKRAAANRRQNLGDPDFVQVPAEAFLSDELARDMARSISRRKARPVKKISAAELARYAANDSRDTTHYSVADAQGNAVSTTYTLGYSFGSGFAVPGTGILLDNQIRNFTYNKPGHANAPAPGKRMLSTMTPVLVFDPQGRLKLVTGSPGGSRIINIVLQLIVNVLDYGMNVAEATQAPRIHQQWRTPQLGVEPGFGPDTLAELRKRGHQIERQQTMGSTQSILLQDGGMHGAADTRRPGAGAVGAELP